MKKVTIPSLLSKKRRGERLTMLTAYDATFGRLVDEAGVDLILVGDSLGMVIQGGENTLGVTVDDVIYHCKAVARGAQRSLIVADMPFMSYQINADETLRNAGRMLAEGQAQAVKMEGAQVAPTIKRVVEAGIPVMGHLGLTPQSVHALGGFVVQGKNQHAAQKMIDEARRLEDAGCFSVVLESVPTVLANSITQALEIPTIGIGAGVGCDGQVLVIYDLLGLNPDFKPKFVKRYAELGVSAREAASAFVDEVQRGVFPAEEHGFKSKQLEGLNLLSPISVRDDDTDSEEAEVLSLYGAPV